MAFIKVVPDQQFSVSGRRHSTYLVHPSLIHLQRLLPYFIGIHQSCALFNDSVLSLTHGAVTQPTVGSINNSSPTTTSVHYLLLPPFPTTRYLRVLRRIYMIQWSSMVLPPKWISYWRIRELRLRSLLVWRWHWGFFALMRRLLNVTLVTPLPFFWRIMLLCGTPSKNCDIFILIVTQILRQWPRFASGWQSLRKIYSLVPTVIRWRDWRLIPYRYALNSWVENLRGRALHITNSMPQHTQLSSKCRERAYLHATSTAHHSHNQCCQFT